jgi:hypothetical protein
VNAFVRDEAEERRLGELHRESLPKRVVEDGVARRVGEIGQDDRVFVGQLGRDRVRVGDSGHPINVQRADDRGCEGNHPSKPREERLACDGRGGFGRWMWRPTSRITIALQSLEVRANLGRVLISKLPILLQALVDDPFQFHRNVGVQPDGVYRRAVEDAIRNDCGAVATKWQCGSRHLVKHDAE